jgi:UDP-N-acetylmuramoyl-tripeptide--D-alanyl-D-alanine ligase
MERLSVKEILKCSQGSLLKGDEKYFINSISTDTRSLKKDDLFIALKGKNFNGHDFIRNAEELGAKGIVVSEDIKNVKDLKFEIIIKVNDTLQSLKSIARYYLSKFKNLKIVGVTGSNGKTTTKDIIAHILGKENKVLKAKGSFNNSIGIPLTVFELNSSHNVLVLEYGTNFIGEIKELVEIASPDISVITNIGRTHLEFFKNERNVLREKMDLINGMKEDKTVIINIDDKYLVTILNSIKGKKILTYGIKNNADINAVDIYDLGERGFKFILRILDKNVEVNFPLLGMHNIYNALAGVSVGFTLGVDINVIKEALEDFKIDSPHRLEKFKIEDILIIDDSYNANPESVREAIRVLSDISGKRKIIVLGDMLELGDKEVEFHKEVGVLVKNYNIDILITLGELSENINLGALESGMSDKNMYHFDNKEGIVNLLKNLLKKGDAVLIKGSRKMKMEEIVLKLKEILRR